MDRAHINPQMIRYIERLVAGDQILSNAKEGKLQLVTAVISTQKDLVNEKPPYRRHYLAHLLASMGRLDMFKAINDISKFRLDLMVDNKSISQIARENNHPEFADFVEHLQASASPPHTAAAATGSSAPAHHAGQPQYSPGFHDDISISIIPAGMSFVTGTFPGSSGHSSSAYHPHPGHNDHFATHSMFHGHNPAPPAASIPVATTSGASGDASDTSVFQTMTEDEQTAYESTVESSLKKLPGSNLLASITCCITKSIFRDPGKPSPDRLFTDHRMKWNTSMFQCLPLMVSLTSVRLLRNGLRLRRVVQRPIKNCPISI